MKPSAAIAYLLLLLSPMCSWSQETDAEYNSLVDEVLELTGALNIGEQLGNLVVVQMFDAIRATNSTLPDHAFDLIQEEVVAVLSESMDSGSFQSLMYPVYARYLTKAHLEAMIAFYGTPEGKHIAEVLPAMTQEGMVAGQTWGQSLGPKIGQRVIQRLAKEGITVE